MNRLTLSLTLLCAALIGCVAGTVANNQTVPDVRAASNSERWEYRCFHTSGFADDVEEKANKQGRKGWEMVGSTLSSNDKNAEAIWCFTRPQP